MKISALIVENIKSFKYKTEITFGSDMSVLIGPNGGGKSNIIGLLGWVLNSRFRRAFQVQRNERNDQVSIQFVTSNSELPEKHWDRPNDPSSIVIEFEITNSDIQGMQKLYDHRKKLTDGYEYLVGASPQNSQYNMQQRKAELELHKHEPSDFFPGEKIRYEIDLADASRNNHVAGLLAHPIAENDDSVDNNALQKARKFLLYICDNELLNAIVDDKEDVVFPYLYYGPTRKTHNLQVSLHNHASLYNQSHDYHNQMANLMLNEDSGVQKASEIAAIVLAEKYLDSIDDCGIAGAKDRLRNLDICKKLDKRFKDFGYEWEMSVVNRNQNTYAMALSRANDQKFFRADQGSSGERQIFNFILGFTCLNIRDSVIIIDEPELHLHPRWQKQLASLLQELSNKLSCQFIVSTHSASFITPDTLDAAVRVYREEGQSRTVKAKDGLKQINAKDTLRLFNAHNNERIFFTEKAVLVEGPSDYIVWKKILELLLVVLNRNEIVEVIEVHGKDNFAKYRSFLNGLEVNNYIIADQDYVFSQNHSELSEIKEFLRLSAKTEKAACDKLLSKHSLDGKKLISTLQSAIENSNANTLIQLLGYIKCRHASTLNLPEALLTKLYVFIDSLEKNEVYVLKRGDLESYIVSDSESTEDDFTRAIKFANDKEGLLKWLSMGASYLGAASQVSENMPSNTEKAAEFANIAFNILGINDIESASRKLIEYNNQYTH